LKAETFQIINSSDSVGNSSRENQIKTRENISTINICITAAAGELRLLKVVLTKPPSFNLKVNVFIYSLQPDGVNL